LSLGRSPRRAPPPSLRIDVHADADAALPC
jgi:hypothetical protein